MILLNEFFENLNKYAETDNDTLSEPILLEDTKYKKKYKCPYCNDRFIRDKLSDHIEKVHQDMINDEFTANRIAFNTINKKITGRCVQDGKETKWNENNCRYDRFCSIKCKDEYTKIAKERMVKKYGKETLLNDPEHQNKMLQGRSISGTYISSKGEKFSYVGSYEKKLLEFEDIVIGLTAMDIVMPGPTIKYEFNGEEHFWITDQYIAPFNLVIDVKDGGDNPNKRNMPEYRAKQDAKEKAIANLGTYNYIRLTDNKFNQLLSVMMSIKYSMVDSFDKDYKPIIRINENTSINLNSICEYNTPIIGRIPEPGMGSIYVVPYMKNMVFDNSEMELDYAISSTNLGTSFYSYDIKKDCFFEIPASKLKNFKMYRYDNPPERISSKNFKPKNILEALLGNEVYSPTRLEYDNHFTEETPFITYLDEVANIAYNSLLNKNDEDYKIPVVKFNESNSIINAFYNNNSKVYLENSNGLISNCYDKIEDIPEYIKNFLSR